VPLLLQGGFDRDVRSGCGRDGLCDEPLGRIQHHHRQPIRQVTMSSTSLPHCYQQFKITP